MAETSNPRPRVVLLTYPSLCGAAVIKQVTAEPDIELVGIGLSDRVYKGKSHLQAVRTMVRRTGWPFTVYAVGMTDVAWAVARALGHPRALRRNALEVRRIRDVNAEETLAWLRALRPDYIASCYFNQIIGDAVVRIPRQRCVNLHAGPLPALRGPEPSFRVIERGLEYTGLTVHEIEPGLDEGPILYQEMRRVPRDVSLGVLDALVWSDGARVLAGWLAGKRGQGVEPRSQQGAPRDYETWPSPKEVRSFSQAGHRLLGVRDVLRITRMIASETNPHFLEPADAAGEEVARRAIARARKT